MTIAIGTDIVEIARIAEAVSRQGGKFIQRVLTASEFTDYQARGETAAFLAKRFAGKEAIAKALGTGIGRGVSFQHIVITNNTQGAPEVNLSGGAADVLKARGGTRILLSLSDERDYALAYAAMI